LRRRLRARLSTIIPVQELKQMYNSFDIVGDIAIIKFPSGNLVNAEIIANQIMAIHKNVRTVFAQTSSILTQFRVRNLRLLYGDNKTNTVHKESDCFFAVDVAKCYFSPRLSYERSRIASIIKPEETIVNMFAGVGCFSIMIAKSVPETKVFSIDVNPTAVQYMVENIRVNRVYGRVFPLSGDSKEIINARLQGVADRVLMPLPEKALEYLPDAISSLKPSGGWVHYYDFEHTTKLENPVLKTKLKVVERLAKLGTKFEVPFARVIRPTGPNWHQVVLDIHVTQVPDKF
jgi:tRNA (guanine37-N1)-methyltransferase